MSIIRHRVISDLLDGKAVLRNSGIVRPWGPLIGTDWTEIRIGMRVSIIDVGALGDTPRFVIGVCSGDSAPWTNKPDVATTNFFGLHTVRATWNNQTNYYGVALAAGVGTRLRAIKRVATTLTEGDNPDESSTSNWNILKHPELGRRTLVIATIIKGDPNWQAKLFSYNSTSTTDETKESLLATIKMATLSKSNYGETVMPSLVFDESPGAINAVNIAWDRELPSAEIEISDLVVARMA